jgi:sulfite reductase alpha subunit-like flavoprotein
LKFLLPEDVSIPVIMVCTGTGIAPFRGFWMERFYQMKHHPNHNYGQFILFYGFRDINKDFLFENEINEMVGNKVITSLYTSVSRDPSNKDKVLQYF